VGHQGGYGRRSIAAYATQILLPELEPGTFVILHNLATNRNVAAAKAMREAGCWLLFLPPDSPDLNLIEMAFSKLKALLRLIGARTFTEMFRALAEICDLFSPGECWNYFKAAGYVSS
jgi:transposase